MILDNGRLALEFDDATGALRAVLHGETNLLTAPETTRSLFRVRLRDPGGTARELSAAEVPLQALEVADTPGAGRATLCFEGPQAAVTVTVSLDPDAAVSRWRLAVTVPGPDTVEWVEVPCVVVPDDFVARGGEGRLLWPALEGTLVEDAGRRDRTFVRYEGVEYPSRGWEGFFPGACSASFMAYLRGAKGLYLGAHDPQAGPKVVEYHTVDAGVQLELRLFAGAVPDRFETTYDVVLATVDGDWYDAASLYRAWWDAECGTGLPTLAERADLPSWLEESPVTVMYPVRGDGDTGGMDPNRFFPYAQALPELDGLARATRSPVLALLMHWEGTAPWAPPYVWPPYGGEAALTAFVDQAHARGHRVGVYGSGVGWTQTSLLTGYSREAEFESLDLQNVMCTAPDGSLALSTICAGAQRWGYDLCVAPTFTRDVFRNEALSVARSGIDYFQALDQNIGGTPYLCYSQDHGHPPAPGPWLVEGMRDLLDDTVKGLEADGRQLVLGTESAAAPPYLQALTFNDARWNFAFMPGRPVPLYAFLYHEYTNNFMGNQVGVSDVIDIPASPENLLQRIAYAFVIGDALALTLRVGGGLAWNWNAPGALAPPDQDAVLELVAELNAWRRSGAAKYLRHGRMIRPLELLGVSDVPLRRTDGDEIPWPSLLTSRWVGAGGRSAQVVVNYRDEPQSCQLRTEEVSLVHDRPDCTPQRVVPEQGKIDLVIPARRCLVVEVVPAASDDRDPTRQGV